MPTDPPPPETYAGAWMGAASSSLTKSAHTRSQSMNFLRTDSPCHPCSHMFTHVRPGESVHKKAENVQSTQPNLHCIAPSSPHFPLRGHTHCTQHLSSLKAFFSPCFDPQKYTNIALKVTHNAATGKLPQSRNSARIFLPESTFSADQVQLHTSTLHCTTLRCTTLCCTTLHCTTLRCTTLRCTTLHYTMLCCTTVHCTTLHCTILLCTTQCCTTYIVLHYVVLHYIVLHYVVQSRQDNTHQTASCVVHIHSWDWLQTHGSDSWCQETARWRQCRTSATGDTHQPECPGP